MTDDLNKIIDAYANIITPDNPIYSGYTIQVLKNNTAEPELFANMFSQFPNNQIDYNETKAALTEYLNDLDPKQVPEFLAKLRDTNHDKDFQLILDESIKAIDDPKKQALAEYTETFLDSHTTTLVDHYTGAVAKTSDLIDTLLVFYSEDDFNKAFENDPKGKQAFLQYVQETNPKQAIILAESLGSDVLQDIFTKTHPSITPNAQTVNAPDLSLNLSTNGTFSFGSPGLDINAITGNNPLAVPSLDASTSNLNLQSNLNIDTPTLDAKGWLEKITGMEIKDDVPAVTTEVSAEKTETVNKEQENAANASPETTARLNAEVTDEGLNNVTDTEKVSTETKVHEPTLSREDLEAMAQHYPLIKAFLERSGTDIPAEGFTMDQFTAEMNQYVNGKDQAYLGLTGSFDFAADITADGNHLSDISLTEHSAESITQAAAATGLAETGHDAALAANESPSGYAQMKSDQIARI